MGAPNKHYFFSHEFRYLVQSGKPPGMKGNSYWRYTHFPMNHDYGRKGSYFRNLNLHAHMLQQNSSSNKIFLGFFCIHVASTKKMNFPCPYAPWDWNSYLHECHEFKPLPFFSEKPPPLKFNKYESQKMMGALVEMYGCFDSGTPQIIHFNRVSIINNPFWGTTIFGNTRISTLKYGGPFDTSALSRKVDVVDETSEGA